MNYKSFIITFFMLTGCYTIDAQEVEQKKNTVYLDVSALIVPPNRLSIGYMRNFGSNYFAGIELGHSIDRYNGRSNGDSEDYMLFAYRLQFGYIFNPNQRFQNYVSVDFIQIHHTETLFDDYFKSSERNNQGNEVLFEYDEIKFKREKIAFNVNYGFFAHFNKSKTFGINPSFGFGVKFVDVTFSDPVNLSLRDEDSNFWDFGSRYRKEGQQTNINGNLQVKLFYKF